MSKKLFVESINAIKKQVEHDWQFCETLNKAFPNSSSANFSLNNDQIYEKIFELLVEANNFNKDAKNWIEYFAWELNFGEENCRLKVHQDNVEVPMSNASQLYDYLNKFYKNP